MSAINEIFGSGSENESENNEVEKEEHEEEHEKNQEEEEEEEEEAVHRSGSDDDDDDIVRKAPKAAAEVFGDELADLSDSEKDEHEQEEAEGGGEEEEGEGEGEEENNIQMHMEEEEEEEEEPEVIDIEIPRVKTDLGNEVHFVKLPNFLSVEPKPFDTETYEDEKSLDTLDEEGKTRIRLKVENTIRWRYEKDADGNLVKQSNAKIVKWSDGSMSMYLGNEIFDVYKAFMQGDNYHLFVRQGSMLQGQTVFKTKLTFRPHSIDSMTHRKMTMSLVESGSKTKKVKILNEIAKNPENKRQELMKQEEEKLKAASRRQNQQRRMREKSHHKGLSAKYLEDRYSDDDNGISLADIKNKFKKGSRNDSKVSINSSSDESDRERRLNKAKLNDYESDEDESESDYEERRKSTTKKKKKKVVTDDDDE